MPDRSRKIRPTITKFNYPKGHKVSRLRQVINLVMDKLPPTVIFLVSPAIKTTRAVCLETNHR